MDARDQKAAEAAIKRYHLGGAAARAVGAGAVGAGADAQQVVAAMGGGYGQQPSFEQLMGMGSLTLALARLRGALIPWGLTTTAEFENGNTAAESIVTNVNPSNEQRIALDTYVASATFKILNTETANAPGSQPINDFFFNQQSGIDFQMRLNGTPGGNPVPYFTPLSALPAIFSGGWLLHWTEWPQIDFQATIDLPYTCKVQVTFNLWAPRCGAAKGDVPEEYRSNCAAAEILQKYGIDCGG